MVSSWQWDVKQGYHLQASYMNMNILICVSPSVARKLVILVLGNHYTFMLYFIFCYEFHISVIDSGEIACGSSVRIERMVRLRLQNDFLVMKRVQCLPALAAHQKYL